MLCQICHAAEASVYVIEAMSNKHTAMHLCENCAQQRHLGDMLAKPAQALQELMASLLQLGSAPTGEDVSVCDHCGLSFADFKQQGRFGCARCYTSFREPLLPLFRQFHQAEEHRGRDDRPSPEVLRPDAQTLRERLRGAVEEENFELAARLRDQLKSLERTDGPCNA